MRTMGVELTSMHRRLNYRARTYTPGAVRKRDSEERTMGVGLTHSTSRSSTSAEKNSDFKTYSPRAGRKRDSGRRTMGVGLTDLISTKKIIAPGPIPPLPSLTGLRP